MDWSTRKKVGCLTMIGVVVVALLAYIIYVKFIKVEPTCFDGKQNQDERGTDCGGVCQLVCPMDAKTVVPLWYRIFEITPGVYSAIAYLENQNTTAGIYQIPYEFRAYDDKNILAGQPVTGITFIGPNERTAVFVSPISTGNRIPRNVFFSFTAPPVWLETDPRYQIPQLVVGNVIMTEETVSPKLSADIINNSFFDYKKIPVVAIIYNEKGNAIHASQTVIDSITQQTTETVYFTWPQPFDEKIGRIEIIPRLNPFIQTP